MDKKAFLKLTNQISYIGSQSQNSETHRRQANQSLPVEPDSPKSGNGVQL